MKKFTLFITGILFLFTTSLFSAPSNKFTKVNLDEDSRWEVLYEGKTYDPVANTSTFTYKVIVNDDPALSHFTLGLPDCENVPLISYSPTQAVSIGLDPTTGVTGIKWDIGLDPGEELIYSITFQGNVSESEIQAVVKAGLFAAYGTRGGPSCNLIVDEQTYSISGIAFLDANKNGVFNTNEPVLPSVLVSLYNASNQFVASAVTTSGGSYLFTNLPAGHYTVAVTNDSSYLNGILFTYFTATTPTSVPVHLTQNVTDVNFGFAPIPEKIVTELDPSDPDGNGIILTGTGKTIGFWKHQLNVVITGKGKAQISAAVMLEYIRNIEQYFLADPFILNSSYKTAFDILKNTSSDPVDLLKKQLLATEFNHFAGLGINTQLQQLLMQWGEYIAANRSFFTSSDILLAKDIFDLINNTGE